MMRNKVASVLMSFLLAVPLSAQDISQIAKSDPLIISGAIGTRNTYYHSSVGNGYRSPLSNMLFANLNISVYGMSLPFSFYYTNDNTSFNYPHLSFNISPTYKNWTGHFGRSNMAFSSYVMNMSFNGIGLEYKDKNMRFGGFYGQLRNAINDDPTDLHARTPQYKRMGWGFHAGYGRGGNFVDLYLLRAYDRPNSIDEGWQSLIRPQENLVVGLKGGVTPVKWLSFNANIATSAFTADRESDHIPDTKYERFDKIFDAKYSSNLRFAGDASMNVMLPFLHTSVFYRMIQPDYTSLGAYYMSNNYHALGVTAATTLFRRLSISGSFSGQADNLSKRQLYTTKGFVYAANVSLPLGQHVSLSAGYNGYLQTQGDGTARVNDTIQVRRAMDSFYFSPSFSAESDNFAHAVGLSASFAQNKDLNHFATHESDVRTIAGGINYVITVKPWETNFQAALNHQQSEGYQTKYISDILSLSTDRSFLREKNLNASATVSLCYNDVKHRQRTMSIGADVALSYILKQFHAFSLSAGLNKYNDVNFTTDDNNYDLTELSVGFNYTYTFSLLQIKRKEKNESK